MIDGSRGEDRTNCSTASRAGGFDTIQNCSTTTIVQAGGNHAGPMTMAHQANGRGGRQAIDEMCEIDSIVVCSKTIMNHAQAW